VASISLRIHERLMPVAIPKIVFNRGELSRLVDARFDLQGYRFGCRTLENFNVLPYGPPEFRTGTAFVGQAKQQCVLRGFVYSETTSYVLELGAAYVRFWSMGGQVESAPATPLELTTPYSLAECYELSIEAINDVVYIAHPNHNVRKLVRISATSWTIEEMPYSYPPMRPANLDRADLLTFTADTPGSISVGDSGELTATGHSPFTSDHVGSYWEILHRNIGASEELSLHSTGAAGIIYSNSIKLRGDWSITTSDRWWGTLIVQRSYDGGSTWETIREFKSKASRNIAATGNQSTLAEIRMGFTAAGDPYGNGASDPWPTTATPPTDFVKARAVLEADEAFIGGVVQVDSFNSSTSVETTVVVDLDQDATATDVWAEGAFSDERGHARNVTLFDGRLALVGNDENPNAHYFSAYDDFENFEYGTDANNAFRFVAAGARNPIQWLLEARGELLGGSLGRETSVAGEAGAQITPQNATVKTGSNIGSDRLRAININDVAVFVQYGGKKLWEFVYSFEKDGYRSVELTRLAEHIAGQEGWIDIAHSRNPYSRWYGVRGDGQVSILAYNRADNIVGWSRMKTRAGDLIQSVAIVPDGQGSDDKYFAIKRSINGSDVYHIEVDFGVAEDWYDEDEPNNPKQFRGLDCHSQLSVTSGDIVSVELIEQNGTSLYGFGAGGPASFKAYRFVVVTSGSHLFADGQFVRLSETGFDALNGVVCRVIVQSPTQFALIHVTKEFDITNIANTGAMPPNGGADVYSNTEITLSDPLLAPKAGFINGVSAPSNPNGLFVPLIESVSGDLFLDGVDSGAWAAYTSGGKFYPAPDLLEPYENLTVGTELGGKWERVLHETTGVTQLAGESVSALVDGFVIEDFGTFDGSGNLTFPDGVYGNRIIFGLPYTGIVETQKLDLELQQGSSRGRKILVHEVVASLYRTWGGRVGLSLDNLQDVHKRSHLSMMDISQLKQDDEVSIRIPGSVEDSPSIFFVQDKPLPATLRALIPKAEGNIE
jgi:hypothetical protein